jgi:hypothetical protein
VRDDGSFEFDPLEDFDDLADGEKRSVAVRITLDGYRERRAPAPGRDGRARCDRGKESTARSW